MKRTYRPGPTLASMTTLTAILTVAFAAPALADQDDFRWRGRVATGDRVEIIGVYGSIDATPTDADHVTVRAAKHADRNDPASVEIRVVEHERGVTICAVYPTPPGRDPNDCRADGHPGDVESNDVEVRFTVDVPVGVDFTGRTVGGDVDVGELSGVVIAGTVNGDVEIDRATWASGSTVNGSIRAVLTSASWDDDLEFSTVNGGISLTVPENVNANLDVETVTGEIDTDFPVLVRGRISPGHVRGTISGGGRGLELETVNGDIRLRSGRPAGG